MGRLRAKQCHARPWTCCAPLQNRGWGRVLALAAGWPGPPGLPAPSPAPALLAGGLGNKGLKKSDNFSPQLDLIFFFDAPTAGGRIAGEEQVRQENPTSGREAAAARAGSQGAGAHARAESQDWGLFRADRKANDYA